MKKISIGIAEDFKDIQEHDYEYYYNLFKHCHPLLIDLFNSFKNNNILPKIGEMIFVENENHDAVYMVTKICYYQNNFICFWVTNIITE